MSCDTDDRETHSKSGCDGAQGDGGAPLIDAQIQQQLGCILRQLSEDLLSQPVPDSFLALLAKLEAREREIG